jgi:maleate cis-trans isomerase
VDRRHRASTPLDVALRLERWALDCYRLPYEREVRWADAVEDAGVFALLRLWFSGTGLPTADVVAPLERALGKPVVTSQAALLWWALRAARVTKPVRDWGMLLASASA